MALLRNPRFRRQVNVPIPTLTERDRQIMRYVFRHRFLRSTHIVALVGGSRQQTLRRLQRLYHHGFLDRPRAQIDYYRRGSQAMVYGLGNKGMTLLEQEDGIPQRKLDWTAQNRTATRFFMEHTLAVAEAMVALECNCRKQGIELIYYFNTAFKWRVPVRADDSTMTISIIPDRVFAWNERRPEERRRSENPCGAARNGDATRECRNKL